MEEEKDIAEAGFRSSKIVRFEQTYDGENYETKIFFANGTHVNIEQTSLDELLSLLTTVFNAQDKPGTAVVMRGPGGKRLMTIAEYLDCSF